MAASTTQCWAGSCRLILMNGRVYDPLLGRFMSADTFMQASGTRLQMFLTLTGYIGGRVMVLALDQTRQPWGKVPQ